MDAAADSPSPDELRLAERLNAAGIRCKAEAKYDEARALYERALSLLVDAPGLRSREIATLYHNLGGIEHARGDYAAAEPLARYGLEIRRSLAESAPDEIAADEVALAAILDGLGMFDEAEELCLGALRVLRRAPRRNAAEIAVALNNLGAQYARRGDLERATSFLDRAAAAKRDLLGADHPDVAVTLNNLGLVWKRRGDLGRAAALYAEAVATFERALGPDHPKTAIARDNAARCDAERGAAAGAHA